MPDDNAVCPYCKKAVGIEANPYQFRSVNFSPERRGGGPRTTTPVQIVSILCSNCHRVLGFVNA